MTPLELRDDSLDGATWVFANKVLAIPWRKQGGDWLEVGTTATIERALKFDEAKNPIPENLHIDVTGIVQHWLAHGNSGFHIRQVSGPVVTFASRKHARAPQLIVDGVACPCTASIQIASSTSSPLQSDTVKSPWLLRFDLGSLTAASSAELVVSIERVLSGAMPARFSLNVLDMPSIVYDPVADGLPQQPTACTAADILTHDDLVDATYVSRNYFLASPVTQDRLTFERDDARGFTWARCWGDPSRNGICSWHKFAQPKNAEPHTLDNAPWRRDFKQGEGLGYDEVYTQYMIRIGEDLKDTYNEAGMKLPGMSGTYEWGNAAVTSPRPPLDGQFEGRLWMSKGSPAHPHFYRWATYWHSATEHPLSDYPRSGLPKYCNKVNFCFRAGRAYLVEQGVKLNTIDANGVPQWDGEYRMWVDRVLVHEETGLLIRRYREAQIQSLPWVNIFHGGTVQPLGRFHIDLGLFITGTKYIGDYFMSGQIPNPDPGPDPDPDPGPDPDPDPDPQPVGEARFVSISIQPQSPAQGMPYTVTWTTEHADLVMHDGQQLPPNGSLQKVAGQDMALVFEAYQRGESREVLVDVVEPAPNDPPEFRTTAINFAEGVPSIVLLSSMTNDPDGDVLVHDVSDISPQLAPLGITVEDMGADVEVRYDGRALGLGSDQRIDDAFRATVSEAQ